MIYIKDKLEKEIKKYCKINNIEDVDDFVSKCTYQGFMIIKFGTSPSDNIIRENNGIKEFNENDKKPIGKKITREDRKEEPKREEIRSKEEESESREEKKEKVKVRKIRVINKD